MTDIQHDVWFYVFFGICIVIWFVGVFHKHQYIMMFFDSIPVLWCWFMIWSWVLTTSVAQITKTTDSDKVFRVAIIASAVMSALTTCIANLILYALIAGLLLLVLIQRVPGYDQAWQFVVSGGAVVTVIVLHLTTACCSCVKERVGKYLRSVYRCFLYSEAVTVLGAYVIFGYTHFIQNSGDYVFVAAGAVGLGIIRLLYLLIIHKIFDIQLTDTTTAPLPKCQTKRCDNTVGPLCHACYLKATNRPHTNDHTVNDETQMLLTEEKEG